MTTLRRILKYTPAVVMGLIAFAWVASEYWKFGVSVELGEPLYSSSIREGTLYVSKPRDVDRIWLDPVFCESIGLGESLSPIPLDPIGPAPFDPGGSEYKTAPRFASFLGALKVFWVRDSWQIRTPILLYLTAVLPFAIGPFLAFRFSLWHYLAYTALVAVELAYYLRWQE